MEIFLVTIITRNQNWSYDLYSRTSRGKAWTYTTTEKTTRLLREDNKDATIYRTRPNDLWANATVRKRTTTIKQQDPITEVFGGGLSMSVGRPMEDYFWFTDSGFPSVSLDIEAMYNQIRNQIRGDAVNLAVACGEYRQTAALFSNLAKAIATKGKSLVRSVKRPQGASKAFLGFQYGVRPLANDILDSIRLLHTGVSTPLYMSGRLSRKDRKTNVSVRSAAANTNWKADVLHYKELRYRTTWRAKLNANFAATTLAKTGMVNPVSVAWELVPYSFVVDWFINVGDVLQSLDNLLIIDELWVNNSTCTKTFEIWNARGYSDSSGNWGSSGMMKKLIREDFRGPNRSISRINSLVYKPSHSVQHIANGLALLHVARGRL
jgi:hypothetical protein